MAVFRVADRLEVAHHPLLRDLLKRDRSALKGWTIMAVNELATILDESVSHQATIFISLLAGAGELLETIPGGYEQAFFLHDAVVHAIERTLSDARGIGKGSPEDRAAKVLRACLRAVGCPDAKVRGLLAWRWKA